MRWRALAVVVVSLLVGAGCMHGSERLVVEGVAQVVSAVSSPDSDEPPRYKRHIVGRVLLRSPAADVPLRGGRVRLESADEVLKEVSTDYRGGFLIVAELADDHYALTVDGCPDFERALFVEKENEYELELLLPPRCAR